MYTQTLIQQSHDALFVPQASSQNAELVSLVTSLEYALSCISAPVRRLDEALVCESLAWLEQLGKDMRSSAKGDGLAFSTHLDRIGFTDRCVSAIAALTSTRKSLAVRRRCGAALATLVRSDQRGLRVSTRVQVATACLKRYQDTDEETARLFSTVLIQDPASYLTGVETAPLMAARRALSKVGVSGLRGYHFQDLMKFLVPKAQVSTEAGSSTSGDWLIRLLGICQIPQKVTTVESTAVADLLDTNHSFQSCWALEECARFCVSARLRTPFGKAVQTFAAFEKAIRSVNALVASDRGAGNSLSGAAPQKTSTDFSPASACKLVEFLFQLEKHLYNAYEGCSTMPQPPLLSSRLFFQETRNRKACEQWFSMMRALVVPFAVATQHLPAALFHGTHHLQQLNASLQSESTAPRIDGVKDYSERWRLVAQFERAMMFLVEVLCQGRQAAAIKGWALWARKRVPQQLGESSPVFQTWMSWLNGAVLEAQGQQERAILEYQKGLSCYVELHSKNTSTAGGGLFYDGVLVDFIVKRIIACCVDTASWTALAAWLDSVKADAKVFPAAKESFEHRRHQLYAAKTMAAFDNVQINENLLTAAPPIADPFKWTHEDIMEVAECKVIRALLDQSLSRAAKLQRLVASEKDLRESLGQTTAFGSLEPRARTLTHLRSLQALQASYTPNSTYSPTMFIPSMPAPLNESTHTVGIWTRLYRYAKHIHAVYDARRSPSDVNDGAAAAAELEPLLVMVIRLARKQQNLGLASRLIDDQIGAQSMGREYERAKLQYALGQYNDAIAGLTHIVLRSRDDPDAGQLLSQHRKGPLRGRVLLRIANWLQDERVTTALSPELLPGFAAAEIWSDTSALPDGPARLEQANESCKQENPLPSLLTEGCLRLAMQWGPDFAKSHLHYAGWCHRQGRRIIARSFDVSQVAGAEGSSAGGDTGTLSVVRAVIQAWAAGQQEPPDMSSKLRSVVELFADTHMSEDIVKMDDDSDKGDTTSRLLAVQSALEQLLPNLEPAELQKLLDAWQSIHTLLLASYRHAVKAYFSFLRIGGGVVRATAPDVSKTKMLDADTLDADSLGVSEEDTITASLRLLRLLVRHGLELKELFAANFGGTPTAAWQRIIPQLFARLAHPSEYVQSEVLKLLCRIGEDSPNLIVYPSVVGLNSASGASAVDGDTPREETTVNAHQNLSKIVQSISAHSPVLVDQIKEMIMELKRITVLWEEQWIDGLMQRTADVNRRLQRLKEEADRVSENKTLRLSEKRRLLREKHTAILKPVLVSLESLQRRTLTKGADSPHEVSFLRLYGPRIEAALEMLRNPKVQEDYDPLRVWQPFEDVLLNLRENSKRRLDLKHISPKLAGRQASAIPMPGLLAGTKAQVVTIQSFQSEVLILPTKTKPKKLALIGSDGRRYSYLFKGLEDLHLDERMMQFLDVVNATFSRARVGVGQRDAFRARNYNVIPLGEQSGLIQWVDGTLPLFSLFKKWQHRKLVQSEEYETNATSQTGKVLAGQEGVTEKPKSTRPVAMPRPSELFYKKLTPALKSRGVKTTALRSKWPKDVLKKVFHDLVRETPGDLILRELHLTSSSPADYLDTMNNFSRSMATMSMIGYIFGLGDRHLDNILLDVTSGEVVHIDFGVCFEKGKRLRVPEVVPFRLTQNFVKALGITGIEGSFRASCEHVLRLLRKSRETLLTLLEAFVYDPLVDWEPDHKSDLEKKAMERNISHTLLASRIVELKVPLRLNWEKLTKFLPPFQDLLDINTTTFRTYMSVQQQLQLYDMELAAVSAAPTDMEAVFESLAALYAEELNENSNMNMIASSIFKSCIGIDQWHEQHVTALEAIRGRHLTVVKTDMANTGRFDLLNAGSPRDVSEFLRSSGQRQLLTQYEEQLVHVRDSVRAYRSGISRCLDALLSYQTIAAAFPRDVVNRNRCYLWCEWRQKLLYEPSTQLCMDILGSFLYAPVARSAAVSCVQMELELVKIIGFKKSDMAAFPFRAAPEARKAELQSEAQLAKTDIVRYAVRGQPSVLDCAFVAALSDQSATLEIEEQRSRDEQQGPMAFNSTMSRFEHMCTEVQVLGDIIGLAHDDPAAKQTGDVALTTTQLQSEDAASTVACFSALQQVFFRLQRLLSNFDNVVLPETITTMQLDYPSVHECVQRLDDVCEDLNAVIDSLQSTDGVDSYARFSVLYSPLKARFDDLVREAQPAGSSELLPWQRLFVSFNAPFAELESALEAFQSTAQHGKFPHAWAKVAPRHPCVDAPAQSAQSVEILSAIFLVKRLEILKSCLFSCRVYSVAFNRRYAEETVEGDQSEFVSTLDCGSPLVRSFINQFYSHRLVGCMSSMFQTVASLMFGALGVDAKRMQADSWATSDGPVTYRELQRVATSRFRESYKTEQHLLQMVSKVDYFTSLQVKLFHVFRAEGVRSVAEAALSFAQLQLTRFQWLHHEVLSKHSKTQPVRPYLDTIMNEMYTSTRDLAAAQASLRVRSEQMYQLESSIAQRLMWAKNSNRALEPVFAAFSAAKESRQNASAEEVKISGILTGISNAIVHMETYRRQNQETMRFTHTFGMLVKSYGKVLSNRDRLRASADQLERALPPNLKELAPGGQVTRVWIEERIANLPGLIQGAKATLNRVTSSLPTQRQALGLQIIEGREVVAETRTLMTELEPLLSPVVAAGDPSAKDLVSSWQAWLRDIELYFEATSGFASELGPVGDSESTKETVVGILNGQNFTHGHAQGLKTVNEKIKRLSNLSTFAGDDLEQPDEPDAEPTVEDVQVGQVTRMKQEKNSHAVGIWKRVRAKLEGRDGENAEKLSVSQQVDTVLQAATSHEHLSQMFEGWTSWI